MTHRRPKSPGSFQDELGGVIERLAQADRKPVAKPEKSKGRGAMDQGNVHDRLFERTWSRSD